MASRCGRPPSYPRGWLPGLRAVGCRPRAALAASTLASRAAIMSTILGFSSATAGSSNSSPAASRLMRSRTWTPVVVLVLAGLELGGQRPNQYFSTELLSGGS